MHIIIRYLGKTTLKTVQIYAMIFSMQILKSFSSNRYVFQIIDLYKAG